MFIAAQARLTPAPRVLTRPVGDELVLLNLETEHYFGLDPVGASMWQVLCDEGTIEAAAAALEGRYDVSAERLRADLEELVEKLVDHQLLSVDDAQP